VSRVFEFHEDVCSLPEGAELLFRGDDVPVQAFRIGERAYGVQFHFEVDTNVIATWCDYTPDLADTWGATKKELLEQAEDLLVAQQGAARAAMRNFLTLAR
ncbi:MAG TPA: hypothetical protein VNP73_02820, partial [Actinomycetota bacterium]|nr:hypothetical protein [Actinomycetota bacterium]